ncbi:hypothetical protein [Streptomyces sp. NPDC006012]|uniref:hypothetical protein n=1 Tax=Streptomyces sp. NPDC006012 TaxID=3364739 RepID=UPI0036D1D8DC
MDRTARCGHATPASPDHRPRPAVSRSGRPAWETPDPARPTVPLDPLLPVRLTEWHGDWAHIVCANGWTAWVDGRFLVAVPHGPAAGRHGRSRPAAGPRRTRPRPLPAAVVDLSAGDLDGQSFGDRTRGLRTGVAVDGESMWMYDADQER